MKEISVNLNREFSDLDLNFTIHPVKKDINKTKAEMAVIYSIKNLVLTGLFEKPFQPLIGSRVRKLLFENMDMITAEALKREIFQTISNFEPRAKLRYVNVNPDFDNNAYKVEVEFMIINKPEPININFMLERLR